MAKYSKNFNRDYEFYLRHIGRFDFAGGAEIPRVTFDENGVDAKRAFFLFDSNGTLAPCNEPELFYKLMVTKKGINFHFKMWAEGFWDLMEPIEFYLDEFDNPPEWVEKALREQKEKESQRRWLNE